MKPMFKSISIILSYAAINAAPLHAQASPSEDIVETAVSAGSFKTLAAALTAAGLVDTLKGEGPFTVFAPTDEAFAKLPAGTVKNLLMPENKAKLTEILTYHVVAGEIPLSEALAAGEGTTLQGSKINFRFDNGNVKIGEVSLITADIKTTNGIIHVIDSVLIPSAPKKSVQASEIGGNLPLPLGKEIVIRTKDDLKKLIEQSKVLSIQIKENGLTEEDADTNASPTPLKTPDQTPGQSPLKLITDLALERVISLKTDDAGRAAILEVTGEALMLTDGVDEVARTEIERTLEKARTQTTDAMRRSGMAAAVTGTLVRIKQRERRNQFLPFKPSSADGETK